RARDRLSRWSRFQSVNNNGFARHGNPELPRLVNGVGIAALLLVARSVKHLSRQLKTRVVASTLGEVACCRLVPRRKRMKQTPTLPRSDIQLEGDPLARIGVSAAPVVLEGRYRLLMRALWQLRHSRRARWGLGLGSAAVMLALAILAGRHFAA